MNTAKQLPPTIMEPMTWAEMCERYPDEWVCVSSRFPINVFDLSRDDIDGLLGMTFLIPARGNYRY